MTVWLLIHEDGMWEQNENYVRGVYATEELAEADRVDRTPSGARSVAWGAHNESCCCVEPWEVHT